MKAAKIITLLFCLLFHNSMSEINQKSNEIIAKFIRSSNKTISLISFDDFAENFIQQIQFTPRMIYKFAPRVLDNCYDYANIDFYVENGTTVNFELEIPIHLRDNLVKTLNLMEFNDFIILTTSNHIEAILRCFVQPLSKFLVILTDSPSIKEKNLMEMLNNTWQQTGGIKVFILIKKNVFSFNPFYLNSDGRFGELNLSQDFTKFDGKFKNLNRYPIKVDLFSSTFANKTVRGAKSILDFEGPDVEVAKTTKYHINATMPLAKNDGAKFGFRFPNGTLTGSLKSIQSRTSDISFVTFFMKDYETRSVEFSAPIFADDLCLVVEKAGRIPPYIVPLITFDQSLWIALGLFLLIGIAFWSFIRLLNNRIYKAFKRKRIRFNLPSHFEKMSMASQYGQIFIDTLILTINAPLRRFPQVQSERFLIGAICLLSLNIVAIFQSGLATCFVQPMYYKNIATLEEFSKTDKLILIKYPAMMTDLFPEDSSELFRKLYNRMILVQKLNLTMFEITDQLKMAGVTRKTTLKFQAEEDLVHQIPECPRSYHLSYIYSKHWILADTVNGIILQLKQSGLISKWIEDVSFRIKLETMRTHSPTAHHRVLRVDDLMLSFMILAFGSCVSSALFIIEILSKRGCRRK